MNVPKHAFIAWLVDLTRVRERLAAAGLCANTDCLLCAQGQDSCLHLFFRCLFSRTISTQIMQWLGIRVAGDECLYTTWKKWGKKRTSKGQQRVCYTTLTATIYYIWHERNHSLRNVAILILSNVVKITKMDVCIRAITCVNEKWCASERESLDRLAG